MRKIILSGFMSSLLFVSVIAYSLPAFAQGSEHSDHSQVEYAFGKITGTDIIIHVAVIVPPGFDKNDVIDQALKYQGAKKIEKSEYSLINGLDWKILNNGNPSVTIYYNANNEPGSINSAGSNIFQTVMNTWNSVDTSNFVFSYGGSTEICPSLVKECGGYVDDEFGFGWVEIKQPSTLGVTYFDTSSGHIDVALTTNKKIPWNTNGSNYDVQTVVLHELGHALGLGHSKVEAAVMYPSYHGEMRVLHVDDECGVKELYGTPCTPGAAPSSDYVIGEDSIANVAYDLKRGKLSVSIALVDDNGVDIALAPVTIKLELNGNLSNNSYTKNTNDQGIVTWNFVGLPSGTYKTHIISADKVGWVGITNDAGFTK